MVHSGGNLSDNILLVEGRSEEALIGHLATLYGLVDRFNIDPKRGLAELLKMLPPLLKSPTWNALGIVTDADQDPRARWNEVASLVEGEGFATPAGPCEGGVIIEETIRHKAKRVGIWLMPDNGSPGELEDFFARMIPKDDPLWPRAIGYIQGIPEKDRGFPLEKTVKAQVYAWLATRKKPGLIGVSVKEGDLDTRNQSTVTFMKWLEALFV